MEQDSDKPRSWFKVAVDRVRHPRRRSRPPDAGASTPLPQSFDGTSKIPTHEGQIGSATETAAGKIASPDPPSWPPSTGRQGTDDIEASAFSPISDTWNDAYEDLKNDELTSHLMERYEQEVAKKARTRTVPGDKLGRLKLMETIAKEKEEELEAGTWKVKFANNQWAVRDIMVPLVGIIQWSKEYVGAAVESSGSLPASAAWAGICLLLPFILNPSEQSAARVEALEKISSIICESALRESTYVQRFGQTAAGIKRELVTAHTTYRAKVRELYKGILTFEATNICFLADGSAKKLLKDLAKWDDWEKMIGDLEKMNLGLRDLDAQWMQLRQEDHWKKWQDNHDQDLRVSEAIKSEMERIAAAITSAQLDSDRRSLLEWLRMKGEQVVPFEFYEQHTNARAAIADTGSWILSLPSLTSWKVTENSFLWLRGKVGSGKSVLSSKIIEHLEESFKNDFRTAVAYFYINYGVQKTQNRKNLTISLISQLLDRRPDTPDALRKLRNSREAKGGLTEKSLNEALHATIKDFDNVFIVLDGLDECPNDTGRHGERDERMAILRLISDLRTYNLKNLHLAAVSRPEFDIDAEFQRQASGSREASFTVDLSTEINANNMTADISTYIESHLKAAKFNSVSVELKSVIRETLIKKAQGLFRYVAFQMPKFKKPVTPNLITEILATLPVDLNEAYRRVLCRVSDHQQRFATLAMSWVAFSRVPLSRAALVEAVLVDIHYTSRYLESNDLVEEEEQYSEQPFNDGDRFDPQEVKDLLPGLLEERDWKIDDWGSMVLMSAGTRTTHDPVIVATHFSLVEYLKSFEVRSDSDEAIRGFALNPETGNTRIAVTCLRYLAFVAEGPKDLTSPKSLLSYAAADGLWHAEVLDRRRWPRVLCQLLLDLFPLNGDSKTLDLLRKLSPTHSRPQPDSSMLYAISRGHWEIASFLAEHTSDTTALDFPDAFHGRTPLSWAAESGRLMFLELLLQKGANPDSRGIYGRTPLSYAAEHGHLDVIEVLLAQINVDPDSKNDYLQTPLYRAAMSGHTRIVEMLLDRGADPDISSRFKQTPLIWAAARGHEEVVSLLISTGRVNIHTTDEERQTPLAWAAAQGFPSIVKLLLDADAQFETRDIFGRTPLLLAKLAGAEEVVRILEDAGAKQEQAERDTMIPSNRSNGLVLGYRYILRSMADSRFTGISGQSRRAFQTEPEERVLELSLPLGGEMHADDSLLKLLMKCRTRLPDGKYFWTERVLRSILTKERVIADLERVHDKTVATDMVERICPTRGQHGSGDGEDNGSFCYMKIYAILLFLKEQRHIQNFISNRFCDKCLPVGVGADHSLGGISFEEASDKFPQCVPRIFDAQWSFCTPYFDLGKDNETKSYIFDDDNIILPFSLLESFDGEELTGSPTSPWKVDSGNPVKIEIDPLSHGFHDLLTKMGASDSVLVLRKIDVRLEHKLKLRGRDPYHYPLRPHLLPILTRYFIRGDLYRIYPCASGSLVQFWDERTNPETSAEKVRWMSAQLAGILDAVCALPPSTRPIEYAEPSPTAILWFRSFGSLGRLVLQDLTIAKWYSYSTTVRFARSSAHGERDRDYAAPEALHWGSEEYDPTWSIGCVFLELFTWLVGGKDLLERFKERRREGYKAPPPPPQEYLKDTSFFEASCSDGSFSGWPSARVRPEVTKWFDILRRHERCTQFVHDGLDVIQKEMMVVISHHRRRSSPQELLRTFKLLHRMCEADVEYCEKPVLRESVGRSGMEDIVDCSSSEWGSMKVKMDFEEQTSTEGGGLPSFKLTHD